MSALSLGLSTLLLVHIVVHLSVCASKPQVSATSSHATRCVSRHGGRMNQQTQTHLRGAEDAWSEVSAQEHAVKEGLVTP